MIAITNVQYFVNGYEIPDIAIAFSSSPLLRIDANSYNVLSILLGEGPTPS